MNPQRNPFVEDTFRYSSIGRPLMNEEHLHHPRPKGFFNGFIAALDFVNQPDVLILDTLKHAAIGGLGGLLTFAIFLPFRRFSQLTVRKIEKFRKENLFGMLHIQKELAVPWFLAGAGIGGSYFLFFHHIWQHPLHSSFWSEAIGHGIYGTVLTMIMINPSLYYAGFLGGSVFGMFMHNLKYYNSLVLYDTPGAVVKLPGYTDEQRRIQAERDHIHFLSLQPQIRDKRLRGLPDSA